MFNEVIFCRTLDVKTYYSIQLFSLTNKAHNTVYGSHLAVSDNAFWHLMKVAKGSFISNRNSRKSNQFSGIILTVWLNESSYLNNEIFTQSLLFISSTLQTGNINICEVNWNNSKMWKKLRQKRFDALRFSPNVGFLLEDNTVKITTKRKFPSEDPFDCCWGFLQL